jgi:hypothetical protein
MPQWLLIVSSHRAPNKPQRPTVTGFLDNRFSSGAEAGASRHSHSLKAMWSEYREYSVSSASSPSQLSGGQHADQLDQTKAQPRGTRPQSRARDTAAPEGGPVCTENLICVDEVRESLKLTRWLHFYALYLPS